MAGRREQGIRKRGGRRRAAEAQSARDRAREDRRQSGWRLWLRRIFLGGIAAVLLAALFLGLAVAFAARGLPSYYQLQATQHGQTIVVRARDGTEIVELGPSAGQWINYGDIPQVMKDAMVAVEDRRYYSHFGIDPVRTLGAALEGITGERYRIGGTSTITQQLARNVFLNSNRSLDRKAREAVLALALEAKFSKQQILELYLNKVYFGGGAYGIDAASRKFFSHPANELSTAEAAIIAGLVKAPSRYSPTADVDAAVSRAGVVLRLMKEQGMIPQSASVNPDAVQLKQDSGTNSVRYFTDWALPQLDLLLPETFEPIEVWTTLDVGMQQAATTAVASNVPGGSQGALVSLDRDGAILALVGGTDYVETNYNRATDALRQPGSSWKLFVYLAALEAGYTPGDTVNDTPVTIEGWSPRNSGGGFAGEMSLRAAFATSKNTVAAQLGNEVGFGSVASMAKRFGITTPINTFPSMVLGSSEVRLLDMTRAFAGVAAKGRSVEPHGIVRVTTANGEILYAHEEARQVPLVPDHVAAGMTDLLQAAVATGTGRAAQIGRPVAGKTGTTSSNKDGYFVGFSSGITTGVWMGRDDNARVDGLQGGRAPAEAFAAFMRYAVKDRPVEAFDTDLGLPDWQLEPDDEYLFGEPDDYYFIDEQGNLIEPGRRDAERRDNPFDVDGERSPDALDRPRDPRPRVAPDGRDPTQPPRPAAPRPNAPRPPVGGTPTDNAPPAASDDFLERATGGGRPDQ